MLLACWFIIKQIAAQAYLVGDFLNLIKSTLTPLSFCLIISLLILTACHWILEAMKWHILTRLIEKTNFTHALRSVLFGLSLSFFTFHTIANYLGRMWQLKSKVRYKVLGAALYSSLVQSYFTYAGGFAGLLYWFQKQYIAVEKYYMFFVLCLCVVNITAIALIYYIPFFSVLLKKNNKWYPYIQVISTYSAKSRLQIIAYSFARYTIFIIQFWFVFKIFYLEIPNTTLLSAITLIFLTKSAIPHLSFLGSLGIRESAALYFLSTYANNSIVILCGTLLMWLCNLFIPALVGLYWSKDMQVLIKK